MEAYQDLEKSWADFNGLDPAGMVACSSGTAALHLALEALQLPPGSKVIVPDFTMIACARAVTLAGLTPVFVDCDARLLMDLDCMSRATTDRGLDDPKRFLARPISCIMAVHVYGRRCSEDVLECAGLWDVRLMEDLAEAHGVNPHPNTNAACWSFYRNKIVAGEEGGAVWFRDPEHAALARQLRCLGFTDAHDFSHVPRGHNYRLANSLAGLIVKNLRAYRADLSGCGLTARREVEAWYDEVCPADWRMPPRDAPWVYDLMLPFKGSLTGELFSDHVVGELRKEGIPARAGFKPMHEQEEYRGCRFVGGSESVPGGRVTHYPMSSQMAARIIYLPIQPGKTTRQDVAKSFEVIGRVLNG